MFDQMRSMFAKKPGESGFDSVAGDAATQVGEMFSPVDERAALADIQSMRGLALQIVFLVVDAVQEDAMPEEMIPSEFLDGLMVTGLDSDGDGEIDPLVNAHLSAHMADAFSSLGVSDEMISDIMGDEVEAADAAIEAAAEIVIANMPDLGDALEQFSKDFIFGFEAKDMYTDDEDGFDSMKKPKKALRAGSSSVKDMNGKKIRYKAVKVVRDGKIKVVNKRMAGQMVKLSAAQRGAMKKLHAKPRKYSSLVKMERSLKTGMKANIYKGNRAAHAARAMKGVNTGYGRHFGDS